MSPDEPHMHAMNNTDSVTGATAAIASFVTTTSLADLPAGAVEKSKKAIADTFAVILAGAGSEVAEPLHRYVKAAGESGASPILGTGMTAGAEMAALVNGTFGHALDFDDVLSMMPAHPSAVIIAAVLASLNGQRVSGRALIEAYALGVEVGGKIGVGITNEHYQRGFHATGSLALFSALAALIKLHGLDVATARQAFGIAGSMASGLRRNFGTMTKPLHTGLAARSALTAFRLAVSGFTAAPDIFEAKAGFFAAYGTARLRPGGHGRGLGRPFVVADPGLALKKFPVLLRLPPRDGRPARAARGARIRRGLGREGDLPHASGRHAGAHLSAAGDGPRRESSAWSTASRRACSTASTASRPSPTTRCAGRRSRRSTPRITAVEDPACRGDDPRLREEKLGQPRLRRGGSRS